MTLLLISFLAGILTILAPCILPLLPIILGRSVEGEEKYKPFMVSGALAFSIIIFTLLLKASTLLIDIPFSVWTSISGGIIILFGLVTLFPSAWEKVSLRINATSSQTLGKVAQKKGVWGDVLVGMALGPVFSSCSPTYFLILATVLPQNFSRGLLYLVSYALGLMLVLVLIGYLGQRMTKRLASFADPHGKFKKILGILFVIVGLAIITGADKKIEAKILNTGFLDISKFEQKLLTEPMEEQMDEEIQINSTDQTLMQKELRYPKYKELVSPDRYLNTEGITIEEFVGKKVILLDIWAYSCINCQRTLPYITAWYDKYKDSGLEIIGIHTPEFAFEKLPQNVQQALDQFGIKYPVILDNEYKTWNAYGNRYWPRKYLIDIDGYIVYDHIGEGAYDETEKKIQELLKERAQRVDENTFIDNSIVQVEAETSKAQSPETYFGSLRNNYLANGIKKKSGVYNFEAPVRFSQNMLYLNGIWNITDEYAQNNSAQAKVIYTYRAKNVYIVGNAQNPVHVQVLRDGVSVTGSAGSDVTDGFVTIHESKLYTLIDEPDGVEQHTLELIIQNPGVALYAFTFG
ncbi:MAG: redoxin family protein [Candidatus Magasanikbacteria bacterium]|nr:redoxin family protein [Candidatus Magasanikbacteria bacterium]